MVFKKTFVYLSLTILIFFLVSAAQNHDYIFPKIEHFPKIKSPRGNRTTVEGVNLGRYLFYDPILSRTGKMSCSSCHRQENAFGYILDDDNRTEDYFILRGRRQIIPLFNKVFEKSFFWDGKEKTLEEQIFHPVRDRREMNLDWKTAEIRLTNNDFYRQKFQQAFGSQKIDSASISKALAQFIRTILSHNSKFDRVMLKKDSLNKDELEGFKLMSSRTANCFTCHNLIPTARKYRTSFADNGLYLYQNNKNYRDSGLAESTNLLKDIGKFKIPSLRNLIYTRPYMHDGRFEYLEDVILFYSQGVTHSRIVDRRMKSRIADKASFSLDQQRKIIKFLMTLSDTVLLTNKEYSNPW